MTDNEKYPFSLPKGTVIAGQYIKVTRGSAKNPQVFIDKNGNYEVDYSAFIDGEWETRAARYDKKTNKRIEN